MIKLYHRIRYFFFHWRGDLYGEGIDAALAWELAGIKARFHDDVTSRWAPVETGGDDGRTD